MSKHSLKYPIFGIDTSLLPTLVEPEEMIGHITKKASELTGLKEGLPFFAAGADKSCESLGVGALHNDMASISYGTASSIQVTNKKYIEPETFLPSYPSPIKNLYNMEVQVYRGYWMLTWFIENFASDIKTEAFIGSRLTEITLPASLSSIEEGAFFECDKLETGYYKGPQAQWEILKTNISTTDNDKLTGAKIICTDGIINGE